MRNSILLLVRGDSFSRLVTRLIRDTPQCLPVDDLDIDWIAVTNTEFVTESHRRSDFEYIKTMNASPLCLGASPDDMRVRRPAGTAAHYAASCELQIFESVAIDRANETLGR